MSHRGYKKTSQVREVLRKEAEARQAEYDKLTLKQKLDKLPPAPAAKKVRAKLLAQKNTSSSNVEVNSNVPEELVKQVEEINASLDQGKKRLTAKERRALENK